MADIGKLEDGNLTKYFVDNDSYDTTTRKVFGIDKTLAQLRALVNN